MPECNMIDGARNVQNESNLKTQNLLQTLKSYMKNEQDEGKRKKNKKKQISWRKNNNIIIGNI
jgi:hypothetical protein